MFSDIKMKKVLIARNEDIFLYQIYHYFLRQWDDFLTQNY
jgi:hypothetical protein